MEEYQKLVNVILKHSHENGVVMDSQSVINFLDHITKEIGDGCEDCAKAMAAYTDGEVTVNA